MKPGFRPLLLPSGNAETGNGERPKTDFEELSIALGGATVLYPPTNRAGFVGRLEARAASDLRHAGTAFLQRGSCSGFVSLSEKVGVPLALLLGARGGVPHVMVAHNLTSDRKRRLQRQTGYLRRFDRIVVLCREQEHYLLEEARLPAERVRFIPDKVDHRFWNPARGEAVVSGMLPIILSVGRERRDYPTLLAAARTLPEFRFVVVSSSPWSRGDGPAAGADLPGNVEVVNGVSWTALRNLYAESSVVVVPLMAATRYAAGVNAVLEAMAMAKPLIVSRTPGIADYIDDGVTGRFVTAADPCALASAISEMAGDLDTARVEGRAARRVVEDGRNLDGYVSALAQIVREVMHAA